MDTKKFFRFNIKFWLRDICKEQNASVQTSKKNKIESRPVICGNMGQQPFLKKICNNKKDLINAKFVDKYGIYLPNHANLSYKNIDYIVKIFKSISIPIKL